MPNKLATLETPASIWTLFLFLGVTSVSVALAVRHWFYLRSRIAKLFCARGRKLISMPMFPPFGKASEPPLRYTLRYLDSSGVEKTSYAWFSGRRWVSSITLSENADGTAAEVCRLDTEDVMTDEEVEEIDRPLSKADAGSTRSAPWPIIIIAAIIVLALAVVLAWH